MTDVLIRNVPDDVVSAIEAKAKRLGLSRTEYLRRQMLRVASTPDEPVSVESLREFAQTFADLGDPRSCGGRGTRGGGGPRRTASRCFKAEAAWKR